MINEKTLKNLSNLARIEINKEEKILSDLEKILNYFKELKAVDTENVSPMTGCNFSENILRADDSRHGVLSDEDLISCLPEKKEGFLLVPPVF